MSGSFTPESCCFLELSLQLTTINQVIRRTKNLYKPEQLLRYDIFSVSYLSAFLAHTHTTENRDVFSNLLPQAVHLP